MSMHREDMSTSSCLWVIILGSNIFTGCIGNSTHLRNSLNLKRNWKTNYVNISRHFNLIKVESTCLLSLILSSRNKRLYPSLVYLEWSTKKKKKKKSNVDGHSEIYDEFLITSYIFLGICLGYCDLPSQPSFFQVNTFNCHRDVKRLQT